ncbi:MAG: aminotransferase class IV [Verrucomicrobiota bacterium]
MPKIITVPVGGSIQIDPVESGFAHGFGLFETIKLSAGSLAFWEAHWLRLKRSAALLGLEFCHSAEEGLEAVRRLACDHDLSNATIKLSLFRDEFGAKLYVYSRPQTQYGTSVKLLLNLGSPMNEHSILSGHKTHNYMENVLLLETAKLAGYDDMIRINTAGHLTECTMGNLFFFDGQILCTPPLEAGILPGTVRAAVLEIAASLSIEIKEGLFEPSDLSGAGAIFMTNSSVGILPVHSVEGIGTRYVARGSKLNQFDEMRSAFPEFERAHSVDL